MIEEAQGNHDQNNYIFERKCSRARSLLVLKWTLLGFLLSISYKSVLRAMMMKVDYDEPIETIDDVLQSDRKFLAQGDTYQRFLLMRDPRPKVQQLARKVEWYEFGTRGPKEGVWKG